MTTPALLTCAHRWRPWAEHGTVGTRRPGSSDYSNRVWTRDCRECGLHQALYLPADSAAPSRDECPQCGWPTAAPARSFGWPPDLSPCDHEGFDCEFLHAVSRCMLRTWCDECEAERTFNLDHSSGGAAR